ncbi:MAG: hypothetical protein IJV62_00305 [Eggerthellaceae bacterium]|nr:hypothetical protein [Eggerthellaceae bacterium]
MLYIREFEYVETCFAVEVYPCDMSGSLQADSFHKAVEATVEWLEGRISYALANKVQVEGGTLGHTPAHNGKVVAVAVRV